jgi:broad specificity phosphatase PhoE
MRELELRRHTMRVQPGQHLSQAGVDLARRVGETMGRFNRVVTSTVPRAFETAIAMGFAVDEQVEAFGSMGAGVDREVDWQGGCVGFQRAARLGGATAKYVREQADLLRQIVAALPEGGRALVVSHGGIVEAQAVGCLPDFDWSAWTEASSYCEGIRLRFEDGRCVGAERLRVSAG